MCNPVRKANEFKEDLNKLGSIMEGIKHITERFAIDFNKKTQPKI